MRAAVVSGAGVLWLLACGSQPCPEPSYEGAATDEAYLSVQDAEAHATVSDARAPAFTVPTAGQVFHAADGAPVFTFTSALMAQRSPTPRRAPERAPEPLWRRALGTVYSSAWAHLAPITGPIFWLRLSATTDRCPLLSVLTTKTTWWADATSWSTLKATAGKTVTLRALSAYLSDNRITEGPFVPSAPVTFSVAP